MTTRRNERSRVKIKILPTTLLDWIERLNMNHDRPIDGLAELSQSRGDQEWLVSPHQADYVTDELKANRR